VTSSWHVAHETMAAAQASATQRGVTLNSFLLGTLAWVLHDALEQRCFAISQTYLGRTMDELRAVGSYSVTQPMVFDFAEEPSLDAECRLVQGETQRILALDVIVQSTQMPTAGYELNDLRPIERPAEVTCQPSTITPVDVFVVNQHSDGYTAMVFYEDGKCDAAWGDGRVEQWMRLWHESMWNFDSLKTTAEAVGCDEMPPPSESRWLRSRPRSVLPVFESPSNCCWLRPPTDLSMATPAWSFIPGIVGEAAKTFAVLVAVMDDYNMIGAGGAIGIDVTSEVLKQCTTWNHLTALYAELLAQMHFETRTRTPVVAYSFGCRIAFAAVAVLTDNGPAVSLLLIDGPVGGPLGSLERAILSKRRPDVVNSLEIRLVALLAEANVTSTPETDSASRHSFAFVTSDEEVGLTEFEAAFPAIPVERIAGSGHSKILSSAREAHSVARHLAYSYESALIQDGHRSASGVEARAATLVDGGACEETLDEPESHVVASTALQPSEGSDSRVDETVSERSPSRSRLMRNVRRWTSLRRSPKGPSP